jgi:hypothetical protein
MSIKHTIAILPFESTDETLTFLGKEITDDNSDFASILHDTNKTNNYLVKNPSYQYIADRVFYTYGGQFEPVVNSILSWITGNSLHP